ncbi:MAG TPA: hypothetical protein PLW34_10410 [Termitinemataceae bacterium]|nr:hypothetical protein [Termitinemataceae bacterium]HOM22882.1 hypothetical protein [Termitinemataceae bacterium]HPQ01280.1 hypothetical protein [Termitinemataceae bacterium]
MNSLIQDLIGLVGSFIYVFLFIGCAEFLSSHGIVSPKTSRKIVHKLLKELWRDLVWEQ